MRSTRLLFNCVVLFLFLLPAFCFAGEDKSSHTIADLLPEAQRSILAALGPGAGTAHAAAQKQDSPNLPEIVFWPQLAKLSSSNCCPYLFGASVAIDGDTIVVGAPNGQYAAVFIKPASGWQNMTEVATLVTSDADACDFGTSVSISGNTIAVGEPQNQFCNTSLGAAYVFIKPPGGWHGTLTQTAKLTASDGAANDGLGFSVSIDGETVVAGAPGTFPTSDHGAAYVFVEPTNGWVNMTQTAKLIASDGMEDDLFGKALSVSGGTVVAGAPNATISGNPLQGAAYVFVEPSSGWTDMTQTAKLTSLYGTQSDSFGTSVAVDGQTAVVGAPYATINSAQAQREGVVYVFVEPASGWMNTTQTANLTSAGGNGGELLGSSVAVEGNRIVAGAPRYQATPSICRFCREGAVYVFEKPLTGWANTTQEAKLTGSDARYFSYVGTSVATGGHLVLAGATFNSRLQRTNGGAYIFVGP
jgi:hypothetical protein